MCPTFLFNLCIVMYGPHRHLVTLDVSIIYSYLMITVIFHGLSLSTISLMCSRSFAHFQRLFAVSSTSISSLFSATTDGNSTTIKHAPSSLPRELYYACPAHTLLPKTARPNVLFAPSTTSLAPYCSKLICLPRTGPRPLPSRPCCLTAVQAKH